MSVRKDWARDWEEEDAAAERTWWMSVTERVVGLVRRSFANAVRVC